LATGEHVFSRIGKGGEAWNWRRRLLAWDEELWSDCCALLIPIVLQVNVNDRWTWQLHVSFGYNVASAYHYLTSRDQTFNNNLLLTVWHKEVPQKITIFAWRLLRNRLSTCDNLIKRRILQPNTSLIQAYAGWKRILIIPFCIEIFMVKFGMLFIIGSDWLQSS